MSNPKNEYWQQRWQDKATGWKEQNPNPLLVNFLPQLQLQPGATIFVPFCGDSVDMNYLAAQGYQVLGCELSSLACEKYFQDNQTAFETIAAEPFTIYKSKHVTIYCGDYFQLTKQILSKVSGVYDRAALIAVEPTTRATYIANLTTKLADFNYLLIALTYENVRQEPPYHLSAAHVEKLFDTDYAITALGVFNNTPACKDLQRRGFINPCEEVYLVKNNLPITDR